MIPWFVAALVDKIVGPFGYCVNVQARSGAFGFERLYIVKGKSPPPLKPRRF